MTFEEPYNFELNDTPVGSIPRCRCNSLSGHARAVQAAEQAAEPDVKFGTCAHPLPSPNPLEGAAPQRERATRASPLLRSADSRTRQQTVNGERPRRSHSRQQTSCRSGLAAKPPYLRRYALACRGHQGLAVVLAQCFVHQFPKLVVKGVVPLRPDFLQDLVLDVVLYFAQVWQPLFLF